VLKRSSHFETNEDVFRKTPFSGIADALIRPRELPALISEFRQQAQAAMSFECFAVFLHDSARRVMRVHHIHLEEPQSVPFEVPVDSTFSGWVWQNQRPLIFPNPALDEIRHAWSIRRLAEKNLRFYCTVPLTTPDRKLGALGIGRFSGSGFTEEEVEFLNRLGEIAAVAIEGVLNREALAAENRRAKILQDVGTVLSNSRNLKSAFQPLSEIIQRVIPHDWAALKVYDEGDQTLRLWVTTKGEAPPLSEGTVALASNIAPSRLALDEGEIKTVELELGSGPDPVKGSMEQPFRAGCFVPLFSSGRPVGTLTLFSKQPYDLSTSDTESLQQIGSQLATALDRDLAHREVGELKTRFKKENLPLEPPEWTNDPSFDEIVGESLPLRRVLGHVKTAATSDATVLILGETGTGKELVARAVHRLSSRRDSPFIKLNCAAIPTGLLESELFGHEKGAFTGAISQKVGRLELADQGTLFLDEVGDIQLELQPKLLRVLQDQEFERLGGTRTIKVNIRLVAATNKDLAESVELHEFRSDLFYRLNVFPLRMPALRDRGSDIPLLVRYFVQKIAKRMNKQIDTIASATMDALQRWPWPGNIRELENFIERSVILTEGSLLEAPIDELNPLDSSVSDGTLLSLERDHILRALRASGGVIAGANGAALRLGLKRTTLQSRMQKMKISRQEYLN